jgi:hypothetical protein
MALAAVVVLVSFIMLRDCFLNWRLRSVPGPMGFPIIGHIPFLLSAPWDKFGEWAAQYGEMYKM